MSKHTSGPWHWGTGWDVPHNTAEGAKGCEKYMDMQLFGPVDVEIIPIRIDHYNPEWDCDENCGPGPTEADRRLIASAPDLLQALQNIVRADWRKWDSEVRDPHEFVLWAKSIARDAIAKAETP